MKGEYQIHANITCMARRRFFVEAVERGHAHISGDRAHHLTNVLRVAAGDKFELSDNQGLYLAEVQTVRKDLVSFAILEPIAAPRARVRTTLLIALIKFERFEWALEKATEVGAGQIVPVIAERSETGLEKAAMKRISRWTRMLREASEQARRARLPELEAPVSIFSILQMDANYRFMLEESKAPPILASLPEVRKTNDRVALVVGPEGGWTDRERVALRDANWTAVSLGDNILRTETAALAGLAMIHAAWASAAD